MKLIFFHGLGQDKKSWDKTFKYLKCKNIEAPDIINNEDNNQTFDTLANKLELKIIEENKRLIICGLSLGAILGLEMYFRHPNKTEALILIAPQYKIPTLFIDFQNIIFRMIPNKLFRKVGLSKKNMISIASSMRTIDYSNKIKDITCPVHIICGDKDKINMKAAIKLKQLLPKSSLYFVHNAKHEVNIDKPNELADIINRIYKEIS